MHIEDNTSVPEDSAHLTHVTEIGEPTPRPSFNIAPEDQHHVDAILAIDPLNGVPGPHRITGGKQLPALKLTALPKPQQHEILGKLASVPDHLRDAKEAELTADAIRAVRPYVRVMGGVGNGATPYHREMASVARDAYDLDREIGSIQDRLDEIERYDTVTNAATGKTEPVPVLLIQGARRTAMLHEMRLLNARRFDLLLADGSHGPGGAKRMQEALYESVQARKVIADNLAEAAEVKARAAAGIREERIAKQVAARVSMARNSS